MKIIKGFLEEELKKALLDKRECEHALSTLPRGVLVKKYVKGHQYYYLAVREKGRVRFAYKGKLFGKDIKHHDGLTKDRIRYRNLLSEIKQRIVFIKKTLRSRELRAV